MVMNKITREDVAEFRKATNLDKRTRELGGTLDHYQQVATKSAIYPGQGTPLGLTYVALKLNGEAGEFAEHVGKAMRDDGYFGYNAFQGRHEGPLTPERRELLIKEVGDVLWYAAAACQELGITLSEAASVNLNKLCGRGERDTLRGSGDNR